MATIKQVIGSKTGGCSVATQYKKSARTYTYYDIAYSRSGYHRYRAAAKRGSAGSMGG